MTPACLQLASSVLPCQPRLRLKHEGLNWKVKAGCGRRLRVCTCCSFSLHAHTNRAWLEFSLVFSLRSRFFTGLVWCDQESFTGAPGLLSTNKHSWVLAPTEQRRINVRKKAGLAGEAVVSFRRVSSGHTRRGLSLWTPDLQNPAVDTDASVWNHSKHLSFIFPH